MKYNIYFPSFKNKILTNIEQQKEYRYKIE